MLARRLTQRGVTLSIGALAPLLSQTSTSAAIPPTLFEATVAAGTTSTIEVSSTVVALSNETIKAMCTAKLKTTLSAFLLIVRAVGGGLVGFGPLTEHRP